MLDILKPDAMETHKHLEHVEAEVYAAKLVAINEARVAMINPFRKMDFSSMPVIDPEGNEIPIERNKEAEEDRSQPQDIVRISIDDESNHLVILCKDCREGIRGVLKGYELTEEEFRFCNRELDSGGDYSAGKKLMNELMPKNREEAIELIRVLQELQEKGIPQSDEEKRVAVLRFMKDPVIDLKRVRTAMGFFHQYRHEGSDEAFPIELEWAIRALKCMIGELPMIGDEEFVEKYRTT